MNIDNQIYIVGSNGSVQISRDRISELLILRAALKQAVGENASWNLWEYRMANIPHIALDIEGAYLRDRSKLLSYF
ncbi:MAG: hypothetical protein ACXWJK_01500 [Burkholderiaceae bacterium]